MRLVTYEWIMPHTKDASLFPRRSNLLPASPPHMNESQMSHIISSGRQNTYEWNMPHAKDIPLFHDYQTLLRHAHKYINESRSIRMRYVTCDTYEWVYHMHTWRINVYNVNMRIHVTCEWVMSYVNESCHVWMSHVMCNVSMRIHVTCECVT